MVERPIGLISVEELVRVLPDLIADALRERDTRPPPSLQATLTKATGVVTTAGDTTAEVQLDEDEPGVVSQVQLANAVRSGDRVVVLLSPGGGAVAIGNGDAQAASQLPVSASFPITFDDGTYTYSIFIDGPGELTITQYPNASPTDDVTINFDTVDLNIDTNDFNLQADNDANISPTRDANIGAGRNVNLDANGGLSKLTLVDDGTAYLEARDGEVVVSSFGGAIQQARLDAGSGAAWCVAESSSGVKTAGLHLDSSLVAEVDDGTWSQPTFRVGRASTGWATLFQTLTAMPPDADLTASDFAFRFDDTPGSAKFEIKGKNSAGTVVTGSIALT